MKIALIDDDAKIRELYRDILSKSFTDLSDICEAGSMHDGIELLKVCSPDIVILDIDLGDGTGFDVLQAIKPYNFSLIFSTAFNDFAIKAIKFSALDYILKPVDEKELVEAVEKAIVSREKTNLERQLKNFFDHYDKTAQSKKLVLKTAGEFNIVEISDIVYCQSDNSYTSFFFENGEEIIVSKGMKEFEDILSEFNFFRPHTSFLVNLNYVKKLDKTDGGFLVLKTGKTIPVSSRKKARLIQILENL